MSKQPNNKPNNSLLAALGLAFFAGIITTGTIVLLWLTTARRHSMAFTSAESVTPTAPASFRLDRVPTPQFDGSTRV